MSDSAADAGARSSIAEENARLYREMAEARRRAEQLYHFAEAVVTADRIETLFEAALGAIETALNVERAAILTFDEKQVMRFRAWRNLSEDYRQAVDGHSPWAPDASAPEPVLVADAQHDPGMAAYAELFRRERIGALAFVPLVTRGQLLGKFMLYYEQPHDFQRAEIETSVGVAHHLASVIARFQAVARLEETLRSNELFAAVLAHDLRNPLEAILKTTELLIRRNNGGTPEADRDLTSMGRILASGQRMARMITQLLDFAQTRAGGTIRLEPRETSLDPLCKQAVNELEVANPEWRFVYDCSGNVSGSWDTDRLLQVLSNLLANAGQHGLPGRDVHLRVDGSSADRVRIVVHNDGDIPEQRLPLLFDPFGTTRVAHPSSRGLGLGLHIVREIVRAHGGTVSVTSTRAEGTTFTLELPRTSPQSLSAPRE